MPVEKHDRVVFDIDGVLVEKANKTPYSERNPKEAMLSRLRSFHEDGFYIILHTARNMNTHEGRLGKINANTAPVLLEWLDEHNVPYDEIHYGKPWCGHDGFYVDDKAIRPSELLDNNREEILDMLDRETRRADL